MEKRIGIVKVLNVFRKANPKAYEKLIKEMSGIVNAEITDDESTTLLGEHPDFDLVSTNSKTFPRYSAEYRHAIWNFKRITD